MTEINKAIDVIVPVRNEKEAIIGFYKRLNAIPLDLKIYFIDNASSDGTREILKTFERAAVIFHVEDKGYGASITDGILTSDSPRLVIIDADCEYPPEAIPVLVERLSEYEVVYGSRFISYKKGSMPLLRSAGNRIVSSIFNLFFGQNVTDLYTGFKVMRRSALSGINLEKKGFEHVLEMAVKLSRKGIRIAEVPIEYSPRAIGHSKMRHISEVLKFLKLIIYYRFFNRKV